jgi:zinc-finger-containing domain
MRTNGEMLPPELCDNCCSVNVVLTTNDRIYGRQHGKWPYVFYCCDCGAAVGCHPNTHVPLGRMADRETRHLRAKAHESFDPLWRSGLMPRSDAYRWLARELEIEDEACHISWLTKDQLKQATQAAATYFAEREHIIERRKDKKRERSIKRSERSKGRIIARKKQR